MSLTSFVRYYIKHRDVEEALSEVLLDEKAY